MQLMPPMSMLGTGGQTAIYQYSIRRRREALGMTQEQMAFRTGLSVSGYRRVETGKRMNTRLATLERIAWVLNCEIKDLL
jgi:transcriptional regulator with XRE-family HTH domain